MTTMSELIEALHEAQTKSAETFDGSYGDDAAHDVCRYLLEHADDIAECERLERAYVAAHRAFWRTGGDATSNSEREQAMLTAQFDLLDWLVRHADDGAAT